MPMCRSPPFLSKNKQTKKEWRTWNEKRILPLCQRAKGQSQRADIQSLLAGKRTREVFRAGGQEKPLALFLSLDHDGHFADSIIDESADVEKIVETQMMIEAVRNAISRLNAEERDIIERLYFNDETVRSVAKLKIITHPALIKRRNKILEKLKKIIEEL